MQLLAVVPVLLAIGLLVDASRDGDDEPAERAPRATTSTTFGFPDDEASLAEVVEAAGIELDVLPLEDRPDVNEPPVIILPDPPDIVFTGVGRVPVHGLSIDDVEARGGGDVGVLLLVPGGGVYADAAPGVDLFGEQGWGWFPMIGPLDAVNQTLATLEVRPSRRSVDTVIRVIAGDFGHGNPDDERLDVDSFRVIRDD